MGVVEHGAEHPFLLLRGPIGPSVAADFVRAASAAPNGKALAGLFHACSLVVRRTGDKAWRGEVGPKRWQMLRGGMLPGLDRRFSLRRR
jgi:hypothetical protein